MQIERDGGVMWVRFDNSARRNALTIPGMGELSAQIAAAAQDDDVDVLVLAGDDESFCSGADLQQTADLTTPDGAGSAMRAANVLVASIASCPKPVIALARGAVAGLGVPIALAADLVICDESSYFLLSFAKIGLMPDGGATALVPASIGRSRAMRMALLAEPMPASEAHSLGLISHLVAATDYESVAADVIGRLARGPRAALRLTKQAVNRSSLDRLGDALELEAMGQVALLQASDFAEGVRAFTDKRSPQFSDR